MKRFIKSTAQTAVHGALLPLEHLLLAKHGASSRWPHIFIVGAPRSGTSLFYELIITRLQLAFFSNAAHRFFKTPAAATLLARPKIRTWSGDYSSRYGHVEGWWAPNEGGHIWRRWIDEHVGVDHAVPDDARYQDMRRTLHAISNILSAPFVNKNVMHSNRLAFMDQQFPRCVFIEIDRNPADTVRSIVRAQRNSGGPALDPANWWSVKPTLAMQHENAGLVGRACVQVAGVAQDIARETTRIGASRYLRVDYEELCRSPNGVLDDVSHFLTANGIAAEMRRDVSLPSEFPHPEARKLDPADEDEISRWFEILGVRA